MIAKGMISLIFTFALTVQLVPLWEDSQADTPMATQEALKILNFTQPIQEITPEALNAQRRKLLSALPALRQNSEALYQDAILKINRAHDALIPIVQAQAKYPVSPTTTELRNIFYQRVKTNREKTCVKILSELLEEKAVAIGQSLNGESVLAELLTKEGGTLAASNAATTKDFYDLFQTIAEMPWREGMTQPSSPVFISEHLLSFMPATSLKKELAIKAHEVHKIKQTARKLARHSKDSKSVFYGLIQLLENEFGNGKDLPNPANAIEIRMEFRNAIKDSIELEPHFFKIPKTATRDEIEAFLYGISHLKDPEDFLKILSINRESRSAQRAIAHYYFTRHQGLSVTTHTPIEESAKIYNRILAAIDPSGVNGAEGMEMIKDAYDYLKTYPKPELTSILIHVASQSNRPEAIQILQDATHATDTSLAKLARSKLKEKGITPSNTSSMLSGMKEKICDLGAIFRASVKK